VCTIVGMRHHLTVPRTCRVVGSSIAAAGLIALTGGGGVHADASLVVTTPYPAVETQPGSSVKLGLTVVSAAPEVVDLAVSGMPDGWSATLRGGGFVIHSITSKPDDGAAADLEIAVAPDAAPGDYPITVTADDSSGGHSVIDVDVIVAEVVNSGISLSADFPSLSGDPTGTFTYTLTVDNETPSQQTFTFDPSAPQGWTVTASPTAQEQAQTITIDAGATADVKVTATPPTSAAEGQYPIDVTVTGANGASGQITLEADVKGTPTLVLGTADQRLDVSGKSNTEKRVPMIVANGGTADLEDVKMAGTAPTGWDVSFEPDSIPNVKPGETAQVTAIIKPDSDAVAGDYSMTVRASAGSLSSSADLRYALEGSRTLGIVAIGVIAAAFAVLAGVFVKFGRR
jgi:uncharacterized membrane protein